VCGKRREGLRERFAEGRGCSRICLCWCYRGLAPSDLWWCASCRSVVLDLTRGDGDVSGAFIWTMESVPQLRETAQWQQTYSDTPAYGGGNELAVQHRHHYDEHRSVLLLTSAGTFRWALPDPHTSYHPHRHDCLTNHGIASMSTPQPPPPHLTRISALGTITNFQSTTWKRSSPTIHTTRMSSGSSLPSRSGRETLITTSTAVQPTPWRRYSCTTSAIAARPSPLRWRWRAPILTNRRQR
jgi:hypothetical protein